MFIQYCSWTKFYLILIVWSRLKIGRIAPRVLWLIFRFRLIELVLEANEHPAWVKSIWIPGHDWLLTDPASKTGEMVLSISCWLLKVVKIDCLWIWTKMITILNDISRSNCYLANWAYILVYEFITSDFYQKVTLTQVWVSVQKCRQKSVLQYNCWFFTKQLSRLLTNVPHATQLAQLTWKYLSPTSKHFFSIGPLQIAQKYFIFSIYFLYSVLDWLDSNLTHGVKTIKMHTKSGSAFYFYLSPNMLIKSLEVKF